MGVTLAGSMFTGKTGYKKPEKRIKKKTDIESGEFMFKSMIAWVYEHAQKTPDKVAVITCVGGGWNKLQRALFSGQWICGFSA